MFFLMVCTAKINMKGTVSFFEKWASLIFRFDYILDTLKIVVESRARCLSPRTGP
jgi:hypothetical protein